LPTADSLEKEEEKEVDNFLDQLCIYGKKYNFWIKGLFMFYIIDKLVLLWSCFLV